MFNDDSYNARQHEYRLRSHESTVLRIHVVFVLCLFVIIKAGLLGFVNDFGLNRDALDLSLFYWGMAEFLFLVVFNFQAVFKRVIYTVRHPSMIVVIMSLFFAFLVALGFSADLRSYHHSLFKADGEYLYCSLLASVVYPFVLFIFKPLTSRNGFEYGG